MITPKNALDAISAKLIAAFPLDPHIPYLDEVPKDFKRPSSLISCMSVDMEQSSLEGVVVRMTFIVRSFVEVDNYHNADSQALYRRGMIQSGLFACGYLPVSDSDTTPIRERAMHVELNKQTFGADYVDTQLVLSLPVPKNDFAAAESPQPTMQHLGIHRVLKEE